MLRLEISYFTESLLYSLSPFWIGTPMISRAENCTNILPLEFCRRKNMGSKPFWKRTQKYSWSKMVTKSRVYCRQSRKSPKVTWFTQIGLYLQCVPDNWRCKAKFFKYNYLFYSSIKWKRPIETEKSMGGRSSNAILKRFWLLCVPRGRTTIWNFPFAVLHYLLTFTLHSSTSITISFFLF